MSLLKQTAGRRHVMQETADPVGIVDKGIRHTKDVGGITEAAYTDSNSKTTVLTDDGVPAASPPLVHAPTHEVGGTDLIDHDVLTGFVLSEHRLLNDAVQSATTLYSSDKIQAIIDLAVVGLLDFKGGYNAATNTPDLDVAPAGIKKGDMYIVTASGLFFTEQVEIGDSLIAQQDDPVALADWVRVQSNINPAHAASVIVKADGTGDATTIVAGIALLPATGGRIFLHGDTFSPATLVIPNKPIEFIGSGSDANGSDGTVINVPAGAALFSCAFGNNYSLRNIKIVGNSSAGQIVWDQTVAIGAGNRVSVSDVVTTAVEKIFKSSSNFVVFASFCNLTTTFTAASRLLDSAANDNDIHMYRCKLESSSVNGPKVNIFARDSELVLTNDMSIDRFCQLTHCTLSQGTLSVFGKASMNGCTFETACDVIAKAGSNPSFTDCTFTSVVARQIDAEAGANKGSVLGCNFTGFTSESVRLTDADQWTIGPNKSDCKVLEAGTSDKNRFRDITTDSTVVGSFSQVNGTIIRTTSPGLGDDIDDGILVGTEWVDTVLKLSFKCISNAVGAAVWHRINLQIKTGTYTGDGTTSQGITGVGFTPKYLKIWRRETVDNTTISIFETIPEIMDDNAAGGTAQHTATASTSHRFRTDRIISLDADGFTVDDAGSNGDPNASGVVYNYMAIG